MPKAIRVYEAGDASVLKIEDGPQRQPGPGEVRLKIRALGLNRAELLFRQGRYLETPRLPARIGYEGAGTVTAVGEGVDAGWLNAQAATVPGFSMSEHGLWAEEAIVPAAVLVHTPPSLPVQATAAIWMQYVTAYGGIVNAGEFHSGDHVLISAASSSVGLAAIQIVRDLGGTSIATTRTSEKKAELLSLGADHVIATAEENIVERTRDITGGKGVPVVFDPVGGRQVEQLAACMARFGRLVLYGGLALEPTPFPFRAALNKQLTMRGYTLHQVSGNPERLAHAVQYISDRVASGTFQPKIAKVFHGLEQIGAAQDYMETNAQVGKIVVVL